MIHRDGKLQIWILELIRDRLESECEIDQMNVAIELLKKLQGTKNEVS